MTRIVNCVVLNREAEGLDAPPHPGSLGERIYENVSKEGWQKWLETALCCTPHSAGGGMSLVMGERPHWLCLPGRYSSWPAS